MRGLLHLLKRTVAMMMMVREKQMPMRRQKMSVQLRLCSEWGRGYRARVVL